MQATVMEKKRITRKILGLLSLILVAALLLGACDLTETLREIELKPLPDKVLRAREPKTTLAILAGSENRELEPLLETFAEDHHVNLEMTYTGSLDMLRVLAWDIVPYDAVWPASSLWLDVAEDRGRVRHAASTSQMPVVFGIRESLAAELGFADGTAEMAELLQAVEDGKLRYTMTSATQSNSGASAYFGMLAAFLGHPETYTAEMFEDAAFRDAITAMLAGVARSSGSSDWLKDVTIAGGYPAMVNYEALILSANRQLEAAGEEPFTVVYPTDGLTVADSPLAFVADNGQSRRDEALQEQAFLDLQAYLLSPDVQEQIAATGRCIDGAPDLETVTLPDGEALTATLNLYQTDFKRPAFNIYLLDYSGSMAGKGRENLIAGLSQIMDQKEAAKTLVQAADDETNVFIMFGTTPAEPLIARGGAELEALQGEFSKHPPKGGTAIFESLTAALDMLEEIDLERVSPAIYLFADGAANGEMDFGAFKDIYETCGIDVPVYAIRYGDADPEELQAIADLTLGRVVDGRYDPGAAFRSVKGYN